MVVLLGEAHSQDKIDREIGAILKRTTQNQNVIIEQPCRIDEVSESMYTFLVEAPLPWIGIIELHQNGIGVFVSRASTAFALLIPYWRFNLSKGEKNVTLFNGEHLMRIFPQNENLGDFTRNLVAAKIAADQQSDSPTW